MGDDARSASQAVGELIIRLHLIAGPLQPFLLEALTDDDLNRHLACTLNAKVDAPSNATMRM